jgi:proteic killer suppression protein
MAIQSFKHKGLQELFEKGRSARVGARYVKNALLILEFLDYAAGPDDLKGFKDFHELKGTRKGTYSTHVTGNYCITFRWKGEDAYDVDFEDYH